MLIYQCKNHALDFNDFMYAFFVYFNVLTQFSNNDNNDNNNNNNNNKNNDNNNNNNKYNSESVILYISTMSVSTCNKTFQNFWILTSFSSIITNNTKCILSSNINKTKQWAQGPKALAFSVVIVDDELTKPRFNRKLRS